MSKNINHKKICNINDIFKFKYINKLILIYLLLFNIKFTVAVATKCPLRKRRTVLSKHEAFIYFHVQKTPVHSWFFAAFPDGQSLIYCLVFSRRSFAFSSNVCFPLHCLFSFDLHLLIYTCWLPLCYCLTLLRTIRVLRTALSKKLYPAS